MNQKTWDKLNSQAKTEHTCVSCSDNITHHKNYDDIRFCENCYKLITDEYNKKRNNLKDREQIEYFGWYSANDYLESVYDELKPLTYSQWAASQPI